MSEVIRLTRQGTPARLAENVLDMSDDIKLLLVAIVEKDGTIRTEWSHIDNHLIALGLVDELRAALREQL